MCSSSVLVFSINRVGSRKSMKPLRNTAANPCARVGVQVENASRRFMTWNNPAKIHATRALCGHVSRCPTQISHLGLVLIPRDENSIYKRARYYPFKGLKHSTASGEHGIAPCATATWHFTLQLTRIRLSHGLHLVGKADEKKPTTVPFSSFRIYSGKTVSVLWRNAGASSAFATEASVDDTLFRSGRKAERDTRAV